MTAFLSFPLTFLRFWYIEAPYQMLFYFGSLNQAFFQLFSLRLLVRTFFQPLKSEYREGLVGFSIGMGIVVKSCIILADLLLFVLLSVFEAVCFFLFLTLPMATVGLLFFKI